jgi:glycosyltransferase involved in cell wall biosynthesis
MSAILKQADVVHNHSLWMLPNSYSSRIAARHSKPVVITAHGALEPWALQNSGWKKRLVGRWFQSAELRAADCIHVNSHAEVAGIREYGLTCPIAVIPNGINMPDLRELSPEESLDRRYPEVRGKRIALFMARLHEKKGLGHLIPAWAIAAQAFPDWHLVVAGPDDGFEQETRRLVASHGVADRVTFTGALQGTRKLAALAAADLFVQPSFSEGFSMAILEAMAVRLPVLMTPGCNFPAAAPAGAAVVVDPDVDSTAAGLQQLLSTSDAERQRMGADGRKLVEDRYTWDTVARQTLDLYRWLCSGGPQPESVVR